MSEREQKLRALVVRGSSEGERQAALRALEKHLTKSATIVVPVNAPRPVAAIGFLVGATLAAFVWGFGPGGCIGMGVLFCWIAKGLS